MARLEEEGVVSKSAGWETSKLRARPWALRTL